MPPVTDIVRIPELRVGARADSFGKRVHSHDGRVQEFIVPDLIIKNAFLLDTETAELRPGASVRVEGEKIVEVAGDGRGLAAAADIPIVDAGGKTVMPGLIDAHVHAAITTLDLGAMTRRSTSWVAIETKFFLEAMLRRGFTTVRDAGGLDQGISIAVERGLIKGPRVFRSDA
jgi:imidazolonepropionase-like amidohydrolase